MSAATVQRALDGVESVIRAADRRGARSVRLDTTRLPREALQRLLARFRADGFAVENTYSEDGRPILELCWGPHQPPPPCNPV